MREREGRNTVPGSRKALRCPLEDWGSVLPRSESESDVCVAEVELYNMGVGDDRFGRKAPPERKEPDGDYGVEGSPGRGVDESCSCCSCGWW
jgi:hypothetical protein